MSKEACRDLGMWTSTSQRWGVLLGPGSMGLPQFYLPQPAFMARVPRGSPSGAQASLLMMLIVHVLTLVFVLWMLMLVVLVMVLRTSQEVL